MHIFFSISSSGEQQIICAIFLISRQPTRSPQKPPRRIRAAGRAMCTGVDLQVKPAEKYSAAGNSTISTASVENLRA
jgi:hypothetical protein